MTNNADINVEIIKNHNIKKTITQSINLTSSFDDFVNNIRTIQENVNAELTKIVEQEKLEITLQDEDIQGLEDSDEDFPSYTTKRKLESKKSKKKIKK